ncbi:hypothetical protein D3C85_1375090 [compost metagenome]
MQVQHGIAVEFGTLDVFDQQLDRRLVVQDHLRFDSSLAVRHLPMLDQLARIEPGIGVSLQMAGRPGQVDQQPIQNGAAVGAYRCLGLRRVADLVQLPAQWLRQVPSAIRLVGIQEIALIAHRLAGLERLIDISEDVPAVRR